MAECVGGECVRHRGKGDGVFWGDAVHSEPVYLDLSDELLCGRLDGSFIIDGALNGRSPSHGLIQEFGVKAV